MIGRVKFFTSDVLSEGDLYPFLVDKRKLYIFVKPVLLLGKKEDPHENHRCETGASSKISYLLLLNVSLRFTEFEALVLQL